MLTIIDHRPETSVLIGASNRADLMDLALLRRFDLSVTLPSPTVEKIHQYLFRYQTDHAIQFPIAIAPLLQESADHPWSTIERTCQQIHQQMILDPQYVAKEA